MGRHWTNEEIHAAVERGNHVSARSPEAIEAYQMEITKKIEKGQAKVILWEDIKDNPPEQLKVSSLVYFGQYLTCRSRLECQLTRSHQ